MHVDALPDLQPGMLDEVAAFFGHDNQRADKDFRLLRSGDAETARALVRHGKGIERGLVPASRVSGPVQGAAKVASLAAERP
jgi:hypothetical protein